MDRVPQAAMDSMLLFFTSSAVLNYSSGRQKGVRAKDSFTDPKDCGVIIIYLGECCSFRHLNQGVSISTTIPTELALGKTSSQAGPRTSVQLAFHRTVGII